MLLTVENLSKEYIKKKIINNVSFSMKKGEILGVLGKSGAGKSTIGKYYFNYQDQQQGLSYLKERLCQKYLEEIFKQFFKIPILH